MAELFKAWGFLRKMWELFLSYFFAMLTKKREPFQWKLSPTTCSIACPHAPCAHAGHKERDSMKDWQTLLTLGSVADVRVLIYWGTAEWSRCQLMGEIAQGMA
eukprot:3632568-Amphidinium_carterae.1